MTDIANKAYPLAPPELESQLLQLVTNANKSAAVKRGANEAIKALNKGKAELILLAADTEPLEILLQLPLVCEDKNVPYVFVKSKVGLGRAAGVSRPVIAVAILSRENHPIQKDIINARTLVENLPI